VTLALAPGSVSWIGGANGVGKTTLLRIITGLLAPDQGSVRVCGLEHHRERREYQRHIAFLSAGSVGLYARMSVRQHLSYWARIAFVPRSDRDQLIEAAIDSFALAALSDRRADRLSMGQRQRLRLAMCFLPRPSLALLDEPRNSLDSEGVAFLGQAVDNVTDRGGAALWCSPIGEDLGFEPDEEYLIVDGRLRPR
jgi:ABC-2 type transport system ATP-binding protein